MSFVFLSKYVPAILRSFYPIILEILKFNFTDFNIIFNPLFFDFECLMNILTNL